MIKANDLMIGNLLQLDKEIVEVFSFNEKEIRCEYGGRTEDFDIDKFKPIKITSDISRSLGYKKTESETICTRFELGAVDLCLWYSGGSNVPGCNNMNIHYVHTRQNIHAITEPRLNIAAVLEANTENDKQKKSNKKAAIPPILMIIMAFIVYMCFAFARREFNPMCWSEFARAMYCFLWAGLSFSVIGIDY